MADFLVVVGAGNEAAAWLESGLRIGAAQGLGAPTGRFASAGCHAVSFARRTAAGSALVHQGAHCLLASGTWFGPDGLRPGREAELLQRIRARGFAAVLRELDGFFALVLCDSGRVHVATDAIGSHHVHVRAAAGVTAVAGSALMLAALADGSLDPVGCQEMLATGVMYEERTPWTEVRALPPASIVEIDGSGMRPTTSWWSIGELRPGSIRGDAAIDAYGEVMTETCARIGRMFAAPVSDLTAGWDSRLLAGFLRRAGVAFATTVTGPADSADVVLSRRIAERLGLRHLVVPEDGALSFAEVADAARLTDGLVNAVGYARVLRVHRRLSDRFEASLNGSFGEVARGYWWEILGAPPTAARELDAARVAKARYVGGAGASSFWPDATRLDPPRHLADVIARIDGRLPDELPGGLPLAFRMDHAYLRLRMRSWQGRIASSTDRLWPCLSPLIARRALEILVCTPAAERAGNRFARRVLARFAPDLAVLPLESGGPALPRTPWNLWRFAPELLTLARRAARKVLGRRTYARTLEETAAPRLALWRDEQLRAVLDPDRMALADHVDRPALRARVAAMQRPEFGDDLAFGNLLALELGLARVRELRRTVRREV